MSVAYEGFNMNSLTFNCAAKIAKGTPVKIFKSDYVMVCGDAETFHGVVVDSDSNYASVQVRGVVTLPYSGTAPATGFNKLAADGKGGVKLSTGGGEFTVFSVDESAKTITFLM